jgi:peptidoglycan/LPS O-acetylase OafA/YrhL
VAKNLNAILWVFTLVGFASVYLNFNHSILKYANEAVYPFYILHQSAMVVVGFYIVQWPLDIASKYILITVGTFLICWLIYEFIIRRNNILRLLFGLKLLERKLVSVSNEPAVALVTDGDIYTNNKTLKNKTIKT